MLSVDVRHVCVIGGVTLAVAAGAYVIWGPSETRRRKGARRVLCPGLVNLGNTCFLNAILQAFASCSSVGDWLAAVVESRHAASQLLSTTLRNVFKVLNNDSVEFTDDYNPSDVMQALYNRGWVISPEEQDAHEMFHVLTETVSEEMTPSCRTLPLFDVSSLEESEVLPSSEAVSRAGTSLPQLTKSSTEHPFHGLLASQLQCKACGYRCAVKYDSFDSISLSLPTQFTGVALSLDQLLRQFVRVECVDDVVCEKCCAVKTCNMGDQPLSRRSASFVKKLTIGKLPACLCIHIQRTVWLDSGVPMKRFDRVCFPEVLDLSPYVYCKRGSTKLRPKTLDIDPSTRLRGGGSAMANGLQSTKSEPVKNSPPSSSPSVRVPYSSPVSMLKALNYHSRQAHCDGLYAAKAPTANSTGLRPGLRSDSSSQELRQLAAAYSTETAAASRTAYRLASVVVHLGDVMSGHFVTYRRAPSFSGRRFPTDWLYTSDLTVRRAPLSEVLACVPYVLLYEKI